MNNLLDSKQILANRKLRNKVKLDDYKTYAYGYQVDSTIKVGDVVTIQQTYGPRGLKGSLTYHENWDNSKTVIEIESRVTRIFRRSDLKDVSDEHKLATPDPGPTPSGNDSVHESKGSTEEWD